MAILSNVQQQLEHMVELNVDWLIQTLNISSHPHPLMAIISRCTIVTQYHTADKGEPSIDTWTDNFHKLKLTLGMKSAYYQPGIFNENDFYN